MTSHRTMMVGRCPRWVVQPAVSTATTTTTTIWWRIGLIRSATSSIRMPLSSLPPPQRASGGGRGDGDGVKNYYHHHANHHHHHRRLLATRWSSSSSLTTTSRSRLILPNNTLTRPPLHQSTDNDYDHPLVMEPAATIDHVSSVMFDPQVHLGSLPSSWANYENETPVGKQLVSYILGVTGRPISTAQFMHFAHLHPQHGYYVKATTQRYDDDDDDNNMDEKQQETNILVGDFVTAPEISSAFTDSLAVWFFATNHNDSYRYIECGPGTGILMADWLNCTIQLQRPLPISIHLIEASPQLRQTQRTTLEKLVQQKWTLLKLEFVGAEVSSSTTKSSSTNNEKATTNDASTTTTTTVGAGASIVRVHWHETMTDCVRCIRKYEQPDKEENNATTKTTKSPVFVVAQEFLDALPVYSFEADAKGRFRERLVDVAVHDDLLDSDEDEDAPATAPTTASPATAAAPSSSTTTTTSTVGTEPVKRQGENQGKTTTVLPKKPRFRVVLAPEVTPPLKLLLPVDADGRLLSPPPPRDDNNDGDPGQNTNTVPNVVVPGTVVEVCPEAIFWAQDVAALIQDVGGAALIVDYGDVNTADSLRGYWNHRQVPFLCRPGHVDVTADVNFGHLLHAVNNNHAKKNSNDEKGSDHQNKVVTAHGPIEQGHFLMSMGIQERIINMMEREETTYEQADDLYRALVRLVGPDEMGKRYKVLAIVNGTTPPPAFEKQPQGDDTTVAASAPPAFPDSDEEEK
jgi:SAM-dependent MidA family methyltransferase